MHPHKAVTNWTADFDHLCPQLIYDFDPKRSIRLARNPRELPQDSMARKS